MINILLSPLRAKEESLLMGAEHEGLMILTDE